ncbi:hypothetical protein [Streptomyces sp. NPDC050560]|uniref:hypothetical protein n=1 Tax=Streptomyces sp. NPDC050560 TaxID=3365630 RepID=UPI0037960124
MGLPSWRDDKLGSMARAALWLLEEVGEGNIFTKAQLRAAFPDVAQIDRRSRDLRNYGWRIDTSRDDLSLRQDEQRFVAKGADVWVPGHAKPAKHRTSLTAAQRGKVFQDDDYLCRTCGIGAGEQYEEDGIVRSQLNVSRRKVVGLDGEVSYQLVTECKRCAAGRAEAEVSLAAVLGEVERLTPLERRVLAGWIETDRRQLSHLEKVWGSYRTLPAEARETVARAARADGANS